MSHTNPLVIVTGGTSGIGFELAKVFANNGYDVAISGSSERVYESAGELRSFGVEAFAHRADAGTHEGVQSFWDYVQSLNRPVDSAVLNVGIAIGGGFAELELKDHLRIVSVNVTGLVHMAHLVTRHMLDHGTGRILVVSSVSATQPTPFKTVYGPSKAFGFSFAEGLREELRGTGVSVTALLPGATDTEFHRNGGMANSMIGRAAKNDRRLVAQQGFDALMQDIDHVVGGDEHTKQVAIDNRTTPEVEKAARHARFVRIDQR
jgi:short-subunit dehydrogenase